MLSQKKAFRLAMKFAKKERKETARKTREFRKLISHKIKSAAKKGAYEIKVHTPEEYQVIAVMTLRSERFNVDTSLESGKRYMTVSW